MAAYDLSSTHGRSGSTGRVALVAPADGLARFMPATPSSAETTVGSDLARVAAHGSSFRAWLRRAVGTLLSPDSTLNSQRQGIGYDITMTRYL